jgi:chromosomal replication initiator protein
MSHSQIVIDAPPSVGHKMHSLEESWKRCGSRLRAELGEDIFSSWFGRLELEAIANGQARFTVPTRFLKSWIESHYLDRIMTALNGEIGGIAGLALAVRSSTRPPCAAPGSAPVRDSARAAPRFEESPHAVALEAAPSPHAPPRRNSEGAAAQEALSGSPLDRRLTFSTFLVGRSNQLAYTAAQRVSETKSGQLPAFSPLYIHASVGLGKTHLLQAIAHSATAQGRRVVYLTAEKFMYGFVAALKTQTALAFKENLRAIDLLIFDDAQFLQGKSIQHEFCHALNALVDAGRQVVIAADRPPGDLEALEERVRSRLAGGLCVEMSGLDEPLRIKILEARIAAAQVTQPNFEVSPAVLAFVARAITSNGRDLDGAVNRLLAHTTLTGATLNVETAEIAIRDLVRTHEPKRVKIEEIQKLVASHYSVTRADILSSRRTATVVKPRQIAMYLAKTLTLRSLPEIGRRFGGRDHTTVLHAVRKIEGLSHADRTLNDELELLKRMLQD